MYRSTPLDLRRLIRPGDRVAWGQGTAEPRTLTEALVSQRGALGGIEVLLGVSFTDTLRPEHADAFHFRALGGFGTNAVLARAGVLEVVPCHISSLPAAIADGELRVDVAFVLVSPADERGRHHLGLATDYTQAAIESARVVVAEVNGNVPRSNGAPTIATDRLAAIVESDRPLVEGPRHRPGPVERRLAEHVATLIPDGATLQIGIGSAPEAVCSALAGHRDLGIHSALVNDAMLDLIERGAITNARKSIDPGVTVCGLLIGSSRLYRFADRNPLLRMAPATYTHAFPTVAAIDRFHAINSAVEVDLTGQVNAEAIGGVHVGAVGGAVDFARGARASAGGRSVVVLRSTAGRGATSRIVPRLTGTVTTPRSDVDVVVTEHGIAELACKSLGERARALIAIADPGFREELERAASALV